MLCDSCSVWAELSTFGLGRWQGKQEQFSIVFVIAKDTWTKCRLLGLSDLHLTLHQLQGKANIHWLAR